MLPSELANSNWIDDVGGVPLATGLPTCQHTTGQRELDYYVLDQRIAPAFDPTQPYTEVSVPPHTPLFLTLQGSLRKAQARILQKVTPLPAKAPLAQDRPDPIE
eukprot:2570665-Pyramimonas_sp.AAC.1